MTDPVEPSISGRVAALVRHFQAIERTHMQGLPILNPRLKVEAVGFASCDDHQLGVLVTPWFMNLVLLPGNGEWSDIEQGSMVGYDLPQGRYEFTVSHDDELGTYLTLVLFRTVADFPDQKTARGVALDVLSRVLSKTPAGTSPDHGTSKSFSRRDLFRRLGAG